MKYWYLKGHNIKMFIKTQRDMRVREGVVDTQYFFDGIEAKCYVLDRTSFYAKVFVNNNDNDAMLNPSVVMEITKKRFDKVYKQIDNVRKAIIACNDMV